MSNALPSMSRAFMIEDMPPMFPSVPMADNVYLCPWRTDNKKYFSTATATFVTATDIQPWLERYGRTLNQVIESPVDIRNQHSPEGLHGYLVYSGLPLGDMATPQELHDMWDAAVMKYLNDFALEKQYASIPVACSYSTSTVPEWAADAEIAIKARDDTWLKANQLAPQIASGAITIETALNQLPVLSWGVQAKSPVRSNIKV